MVPTSPGSEAFDDAQVLDAIARTDYDKPVAPNARLPRRRLPPLPREGGVFPPLPGWLRER